MRILVWIPGLFWLYPFLKYDDYKEIIWAPHALYSGTQIFAGLLLLGRIL